MYTTEEYLLDRTLIHDTVTNFYLNTDLKRWDQLRSAVSTSGITLDYTHLLGTPPQSISSDDLVGMFQGMLSKTSKTQHLITGIIPQNLPYPSEKAERPSEVTVIANAIVNIFREGIEGGNHLSNGGRGELVLVREEKADKGNPWRVKRFATMEGFWIKGNMKVFE